MEKKFALAGVPLDKLDQMLDLEEGKHDESIQFTEGQIQLVNDEINALQDQLDYVPTLKQEKLANLKAEYIKLTGAVEMSADKEAKNIQGDLDKLKSKSDELTEVLESKKTTKRQYVALTRRLSKLVRSAHSCVKKINSKLTSQKSDDLAKENLEAEYTAAKEEHKKAHREYVKEKKELGFD